MHGLIQALQLILSLSILVVLHEFGHFIAAKIFKTKVERFYLFFNPWFSLFKKKIGATEFGIGWIPFGGYVKIAGMIDESLDKKQLQKETQPWEFRAKPAWQRFIIMIAGVSVNFILGIFIYAMIVYTWGEKTLPPANVKYGIECDTLCQKLGFKEGDIILSVEGKEVDDFLKIPLEIVLKEAKHVEVLRNNKKEIININENYLPLILKNPRFLMPRIPFIIDSIPPNSNAKKFGLKKGDRIIAVNGKNTPFFNDVKNIFSQNAGKEITITVKRDTMKKIFNVKINKEGKLGVFLLSDLSKIFKLKEKHYSLFQAFPAGIKKGYDACINTLLQLKLIFSPKMKGYKSVGSFITIAKQFDSNWNWLRFWNITAFLSILLSVMNILPIPALDGGHIVFLLYEMITRKKPSDKVLEYAQIAGMLILAAILILALGNDIIRWLT